MKALFFAFLVLFSGITTAQNKIHQGKDKLESDFFNPPHSAHVQALWHWQGSYFSKEGITKDLEAMKEAELGGAMILNINRITENNPWPLNTYRGESYFEALHHAVKEAERLGLTIGIHNGPGYTGTGGPWIPESKNMRQLAWIKENVRGPQLVNLVLPEPAPCITGHNTHLRKKSTLYNDLAVYAVPDKKEIKSDQIIVLSEFMQPDGRLEWNVPQGQWSIYRLGYAPTMEQSHPIEDNLVGKTLEVDKLDKEANIYHWQHVMDPLKQKLGSYFGTSFNNVYIESYECGTMNWTPDFRKEFIKQKGYDPVPWLLTFGTPVLGMKPKQYNGSMMSGMPREEQSKIINSNEETNRFDWDFSDVVNRLYNDNILLAKNMLNAENIKFSYEAYHGPFNTAEGMARANIPTATFWTKNSWDPNSGTGVISSSISGGARAAGNPILAAESFTSMANVSKWTEIPGDLKFVADGALSSGVNQMVLHHWVHQPFSDKIQPGMTNNAWGVNFGRHQTWIKPGKIFFTYINRCQAMLQQGEEVVDCITLDHGHDNNGARIAQDKTDLISYYDFLQDNTKVENGKIVLSSGRAYFYLIGPPDGVIIPEVAEKLRNLVQEGATIVCGKFVKSPSKENYPMCDESIKKIAKELWSNPEYAKRLCSTEQEAKKNLKLQHDWNVIRGNKPDSVRAIHRHSDLGDIYFVVNRSTQPQNLRVSFRLENLIPEIWQPENLSIFDAPIWKNIDGRTEVEISLKGLQSTFVVFRKPANKHEYITSITLSNSSTFWIIQPNESGKLYFSSSEKNTVNLRHSSGKEKIIKVSDPYSIAFNGGWDVFFNPKLGQNFSIHFPKLVDFSKHENKEINYFSGTASYRKNIQLDKNTLKSNRRVVLDLGEMYDIATVRVNNNAELIVWYPPYRIDITKYLVKGTNSFEINVTNTWANAVIGDEQIPADFKMGKSGLDGANTAVLPEWVINGQPVPPKRKTFAMWNYYNSNSSLQPAGLVGPVRLLVEDKTFLR